MSINEIMILVFLMNLPFGYMRGNAKKFSMKWIMAIHIPVPFVFLMRIITGLSYTVIPLLILSDIAGQIAGAKLRKIDLNRSTRVIE